MRPERRGICSARSVYCRRKRRNIVGISCRCSRREGRCKIQNSAQIPKNGGEAVGLFRRGKSYESNADGNGCLLAQMLNSLVAHSVHQTGNCLRLRLIQMLQHSGALMGKFQYALHGVTIAFHTKQEPSRVLAGKGGEIDPHIRSIFSEGGVMDTLGQPLPTTSFFPQDHQTQGRVRVLQGQASIAVQSRTTGHPVRKGALGLSDSTIINGFSASLFINLLGVSFLCSAAISNGALETVSKKFLRLAGGRSFVAPIMIYIIGFAVAAIGPGCVPALGIVSALSLPPGQVHRLQRRHAGGHWRYRLLCRALLAPDPRISAHQ